MPWAPTVPLRRVFRCFLAGVLAILPVVITLAVVLWAAGFVRDILGPNGIAGESFRRVGLQFVSNSALAYGIGVLLALCAVLAVGLLVESGARSLLERAQDAVFSRIPIVGDLYGTSKQLVAVLNRKDPASMKGMRAVFCSFGKDGGGVVLALLVSSQRFRIQGREYHIVLVPTAPVPIGGGLLFVPVETVRPAAVSMEAMMSIYISMGITAPQFLPTAPPAVPSPG